MAQAASWSSELYTLSSVPAYHTGFSETPTLNMGQPYSSTHRPVGSKQPLKVLKGAIEPVIALWVGASVHIDQFRREQHRELESEPASPWGAARGRSASVKGLVCMHHASTPWDMPLSSPLVQRGFASNLFCL